MATPNLSESERYDTVGVMRSDLHELTARIQLITLERNQLERQLSKTQLERLQLLQESDDRLDDQAQRYEEKITELHSVIAELSKKLDAQRPNLIREEDEVSQNSGDSPQRSSTNNNNANECCTDYEDDSVAVPAMAVLESGLRVQMELPDKQRTFAKDLCCQDDQCYDCQHVEDSSVDDKQFPGCKEGSYCCGGRCSPSSSGVLHSNHALQMTQLRRELLALRTEGDMFRSQVSRQEGELNKARANVSSLKEERDRLRRKIRELQIRVQSLLTQQGSQGSTSGSPARSKSPHLNPTTGERTPTSREDAPIAKIAERVKLKKVESGDRHISGSDIISAGVSNSKVAEHLVRSVQEDSNAQEILQSLHSSGSHVPELRVREFEVETERLNSKVEHMQSQNDLLVLALEESRTQCDRLSVLIGKYESNNTALQLALACTDHALEASEALQRLQETESQLLALGLAAAGVTMTSGAQANVNNEQAIRDASVALRRAQESRKTAEAVAKRLLQRLDRGLQGTYPSVTACAISPWEDLSSHSHTTSTTSSTSSCGLHDGDTLTPTDIQRLREFVRQMQGERAAIRATISELESVHIDPVVREPSCKADAQRLDLENAVLMQELMALKEEKAELRAQYYLLEKEKSALELRLSSREAQEHAYMVQIEHLKCEVREQQQAKEKLLVFHNGGTDSGRGSHNSATLDSSTCPSGCGDDLAQNLMEGLQREKRLKCRVQELVSTLEKVSRNSELRHQQSAEFVSDLKRANSALISAFEKSKKKYQSKFKRMEQQMLTLVERHTTQVRVLQNRIAAMDEQSNLQSQQCTSETSL